MRALTIGASAGAIPNNAIAANGDFIVSQPLGRMLDGMRSIFNSNKFRKLRDLRTLRIDKLSASYLHFMK